MVVFALVMASPAGQVIDAGLTTHFRAMNERRLNRSLSWVDGIEIQLLYNFIATVGRMVYPEAGQIVWHYLHGGGSSLWLDPSYLQNSPVVIRSLNTLSVGESRQFAVKYQRIEPRLTYAFNPFSLRRSRREVLLYQKIAFKDDRKTYTRINYWVGRGFLLPDGLIHATRPKKFWAYAKWSIEQQNISK